MDAPKPPAWLPDELGALEFGSPDFKACNAALVAEDEAVCAPVVRGMPTWLGVTGTTVCNLKCIQCNLTTDPDWPKWFMAEEVYQKVVDELYPFVRTVQFSAAGEPLMTPGMEHKLADLKRTHTRLEIVTNGTLMMRRSRFREQLIDVLELVTFSIDGATRSTYNSIRVGADFDEVLDNVRAFAAYRAAMPAQRRPRMHFNYVLMERTLEEAPRFVELVHELGGDEIVFNHLVLFDASMRSEQLGRNPARANEWLARTRATADALGLCVQLPPPFATGATSAPEPRRSAPTGRPSVKCWFLWNRAYITPHGEVVPCCLAGIPHLGSMMQPGGFRAVWNDDEYQRYRRHVFTDAPYGPCRSCYFIHPSPELSGAGHDFSGAR